MKCARTRVIGIGQPNAGDDNVGIGIARALLGHQVPAGVEIHEITDPARLIELLDGTRCAILVDALVSDSCPGNITCLTPEELAASRLTPLSTHATSVSDAILLARILATETPCCDIRIIGITIEPPKKYTHALSSPVAAALPRAVNLILKLLEDDKVLSCV